MNNFSNSDPLNEAFEPVRKSVVINVGNYVECRNQTYRIEQVLDFESVIGVNVETGRHQQLRINELRSITDPESKNSYVDLHEIADTQWKIAETRFAAIQPLINNPFAGRKDVEARAKEIDVNPATLYRWLKRYRGYGSTSALLPMQRGWSEGKSRLPTETVEIIENVIQDFYLTNQRATPSQTVIEVLRICNEKEIPAPSPSAIRYRISRVAEKDQLRYRGYKEKAKNKFLPAAGSFPNADYPLSVIQIDHTPADIILVDDIYRKPVGRPWITLAIDVHSRMVTGYYLSFDPPSETSVAMCVAHSVIPKDDWLLLHKVDADWPVWGWMRTIHVDNGPDFRAGNFRQSCTNYGVNLEFRPVRQPRYGGHIERLLGTFLREIHLLPGTTHSSIKDRDGYDSEAHAVMTKTEFEEWLVKLICKVYHQRKHSSLGMSPAKKWEIGIFGNSEIQGAGLPPKPNDGFTVQLDFLPAFSRTVQAFGVTIDGLRYYSEILRPWINAKDRDTNKKHELTFRRDPRDISHVWFFDPEIKSYFKIPFANQALPSMSLWEYNKARETMKQMGDSKADEHRVLRAITELRSIVAQSEEKTKKARRQAQRRREHERNISPAKPFPATTPMASSIPASMSEAGSDLTFDDIDDFGDIA